MTARMAPLAMVGFLALGAIDTWLAAVAVEAFTASDPSPNGKFEWVPKLSTATEGMPPPKPLDAYKQTLAYPIFFKTREPFVAPPPPPPPPPPQVVVPRPVVTDPGIALGGVTITRGIRKAYLISKADPRGTWVNEGEDFMGWKVASIGETSTKLQQQDRTIELELYAQR
jgi:hypothetical protein